MHKIYYKYIMIIEIKIKIKKKIMLDKTYLFD